LLTLLAFSTLHVALTLTLDLLRALAFRTLDGAMLRARTTRGWLRSRAAPPLGAAHASRSRRAALAPPPP
jgi:hypothetical protein